jgi:hypothetical protein
MGTLRDNRLEEFFGDGFEALKHTVKCEEASAPCRGVRGSSIPRCLTGLRRRLDTYVHLLDNDLGEPLKHAVHEG